MNFETPLSQTPSPESGPQPARIPTPDQYLGSAGDASEPETFPVPPDRAGRIESIANELGVDFRSPEGAAAVRREVEELLAILDLLQEAD